jgi:DNA-binding NtrC family response regulator
MNVPRLLIADDTSASLTLLRNLLEPRGYEIIAASNGRDAIRLAEKTKPDLILLDVVMPDHDGFMVCRTLKSEPATAEVPVIFVTSRQETKSVLRGFQVGAVDYIFKPFQAEEVVTRVATHLKISLLNRELQQRNHELEEEIQRRKKAETSRDKAQQRITTLVSDQAERWGLSGFVGDSLHLRRIVAEIERLKQFGKTSVLITGESGTGKELIARGLHHHSPRAEGPFVPVNCVAIPADLAESLFFGHVKGSFTGAATDRKGYFEMADGGTLFLDEIGDMPATLQAKLLRVLEDGEVTPVGAAQSKRVDVRVLSATNADLSKNVATGEFRQDLYYRLARYSIATPALRERIEDLPLLASHFIKVFATEMGLPAPKLTKEGLALLSNYSFPGNVRELKNVMERALILSSGADLRPEHLQGLQAVSKAATESAAATPEIPFNLEEAELVLIQRALTHTGGNVAEAARLLGVNRSRIYRRYPHLG